MLNDLDAPADDDPVIFHYAASCNISFRGQDDSGYTWGEWREMSQEQRREAYDFFIWNVLGVEVYEG